MFKFYISVTYKCNRLINESTKFLSRDYIHISYYIDYLQFLPKPMIVLYGLLYRFLFLADEWTNRFKYFSRE